MSILKRTMQTVVAIILAVACSFSVFSVISVNAEEASEEERTEYRDTYSDTWALTDALGREAPDYEEAGGVRGEKYVGIFYLIWHHDYMQGTLARDPQAPRNISQILRENPKAIDDADAFGPTGTYHYWGEPLYGYYDLEYDDYVLRKHAQQLTDAGVDFLILDATNYYYDGRHNEESWNWGTLMNLCEVFTQVQNEGGKVPKITFQLTWSGTNSAGALTQFYREFYSKGLYQNLWFYYEGKPLILADRGGIDLLSDNTVSATEKEEMKNFFTFRKGQPEITAPTAANTWDWLSIYPQQPAFTESNTKECVVVSPAQNWGETLDAMSAIDANGNFISRGRSWTSTERIFTDDPQDPAFRSAEGLNFQEQFDRALNIDPDIIFLTEWNEWIMGRFNAPWSGGSPYMNEMGTYADNFNTEFSRDIEMTREGGLGDNYYNQMVANIRRFKGVRTQPDYKNIATMEIDGNFGDWSSIPSYYKDDIGDPAKRDAAGIGRDNYYTNDTGRNDFKDIKVARDDKNVYFYVETEGDISPYTDKAWMNLFISTGYERNWEGYDFVLNRTGVRDGMTTLERSQGGWNWKTVNSSIPYKVTGNQMEIAIPLSDLHLNSENVNFEFKFSDNMQEEGDALDFYINGDCAPNSRFSYVYSEKAVYNDQTSATDLYEMDKSQEEALYLSDHTVGLRFEAVERFTSFSVQFYAETNYDFYYGDEKVSAQMSLYRWNTNYATSTSAQPLKEITIENISDKTWGNLVLDEPLSSGEYIVVIKNFSPGSGLYCYDFTEQEEGTYNEYTLAYYDGLRATGYNFLSRIRYYAAANTTVASSKTALTDGTTETWAETPKAAANTENEFVVELNDVTFLNGIRLAPVVKNGIVQAFPKSFKFSYSIDGTNYADIPNQTYSDYNATPAIQDFRFANVIQAKYIKVTVLESDVTNGQYYSALSEICVTVPSASRTKVLSTLTGEQLIVPVVDAEHGWVIAVSVVAGVVAFGCAVAAVLIVVKKKKEK